MYAQPYEALRAVPPLDQKVQMGWLLSARLAAQKAWNAALSAPRKAAGYLARLVQSAHLGGALSWLRSALTGVTSPLLMIGRRLGKTGIAAAVTAIVTDPTCRQLLGKGVAVLARGVGAAAKLAYRAVDGGLRCFGAPGKKAADALFAMSVTAVGKVTSVAGPTFRTVARWSDPRTAQTRVVSGIARTYVLHRALRALVGNTFARLLIEGLLAPALVDSRLASWLRRQVAVIRQRAMHLQEQTEALSQPAAQPRTAPEGSASPELPYEPPMAAGEDLAMPLWLVDEDLTPSNRAERRAQQRTKPRNPRHQ